MYSILNTIIEVKLKHLPTFSLLCTLYLILLPVVTTIFLIQKRIDPSMSFPTGDTLWVVAAVAVMFLIADYMYYGAFAKGGNVVTITTLLVLMPVLSGLLKFLWVKELPTPYHFGAVVLAAGAVILVAIGNTKKSPAVAESTQITPVVAKAK